MRKVVLVLALIACDYSRDVLVHGDSIRKLEADDYEYQKELRGQLADFDTEVTAESPEEDRERSSEPIGKWRNNGEALEPKWRDGDSVPLLPFSHFQSYSRDEVDDADEDGFPETGRRPFKYRYALNQSNRHRDSSDGRLPTYDHDTAYRDDTEDYPRRRRRPLKNHPHSLTFPGETIESAASNDGKRGRNLVSDSLNDKEATSRYREAFQAREYEHEFSDEEYSKPRPRKRRPPQNYEFALANETPSSGDESRNDSSATSSRPRDPDEHRPTPQPPNDDRENTLELKMLLKMQQEEGSSLSEILQRRNLTLADLLKGKADVINALKSRNTDESYEYIEEMSRAMSDSLMKLATTTTTTSTNWRSTTQTSTILESVAIKPTSASSTVDNLFAITVIPDKISRSYERISSNDTNNVKRESEDTERVTQPVQDSSLPITTIPTIAATKTSTFPPIVAKSTDNFQSDDSNAGLTGDRAVKQRNLDEEEIMEFSDFTDFKKSKNSEVPVSVGQLSEIAPSQPPRDTESTLSIEQILNPTERTGHARNYKSDRSKNSNGEDNNNEKVTFIQDESQSIRISEPSVEEYDTFIEAEYQNDAPISEDDGVQDEASDDAVLSVETTKQAASPVDSEKQSFDNYSAVYRDPSQSAEGEIRDRTLENYRGDAGDRRYEEVVSEIEPEARAEIFELFASGSAGKRLERLLKSRNMSVEELIALRQRGSSKVHLTEVSRLRIPNPKNLQTFEPSSTNNGKNTVALSPVSNSDRGKTEKEDTKQELDRTMSRFAQNIESYLRDPLFDKDTENGSMSRLLDLVERDRNTPATFSENGTSNTDERDENPRRTMQIVDLLTTFGSLPFAKDVQRQFEAEVGNNNEHEQRAKVSLYNVSVAVIDREKTVRSDNSSSEFHQVESVEEVVKEEPNTIDIKAIYDETVSSKNDGEEKKTLSKLKPSIIASGAILGVALIVFLAIFIVCRIKQKQKYTYRNTLSRAVFQGPVMVARKLSNSSSLSTVMVNVVATSTTKRPDRTEMQEANFADEFDSKSDMDNDSLDANDSWETIPDYAK